MGYAIYSFDHEVFTRLTTNPARKDGLILADHLIEMFEDGEFTDDKDEQPAMWQLDRNSLADLILERLRSPDWYSDLSLEDAHVWDHVLYSLQDAPGRSLKIGYRISDYDQIDWPCAQFAARHGATMLEEPTFANRGYRYLGKPKDEFSPYPMYSLYLPDEAQKLLAQLEAVESHFEPLQGGESSIREQFYDGLLAPIRKFTTRRRVIWVQTYT